MTQMIDSTGSNSHDIGCTPNNDRNALSGPSRASKIHFHAMAAGTSDTTCGMNTAVS
ncbi:hypothetical protein D3C81_2293620 [compost metagenome]